MAFSVGAASSASPGMTRRPRTSPGATSARASPRAARHRIEALQRNKQFVAEHRAARLAWLAGIPVIFPAGTYWLRRFAGVPVAAVG